MWMKSIKRFCFLFIIITVWTINVSALEINSKYAVLYNLNDGTVVYEKEKDEVTSVASLTKIMTTLVAIKNIKDFDEKVVMRKEMFAGLREANAYVIGLKVGQKVTYNDLVYGMFLASGADATRAVAISVAGSEEKFVNLMNEEAKRLGLKKTHFVNTVGLDAEGHYSTVNEIAIILKEAFKNEKFKEIFLKDKYVFSDSSITVYSSMRRSLNAYKINGENILGGKTGYTGDAGRCLASIAYDKKNKITYLLVTVKAEKNNEPVEDAYNIYHYYFENYGYQKLVEKGDLLVSIPTKYSKIKEMKFRASNDIEKYLKNDYKSNYVKVNYKGIRKITPMMKKGNKLGVVEVRYKDEVVKEIDVVLSNTVKFSLLGFLFVYRWVITSIIFIIIIICLVVFKKKYKKV